MFTYVYRFERNGLGPYLSRHEAGMSQELLRILYKHNGCVHHPAPEEDESPLRNQWFNFGPGKFQHLCGFSSMEQLNNWFDQRCQELLIEAGFKLRCIRVPARAVIHGRYQVMIHKKYLNP